MSFAAAQPAKWNLQCIRSWRMQETQNHLGLLIVFQMQVTRKAIYVHCKLTCRLNCPERKVLTEKRAFGREKNQPNA